MFLWLYGLAFSLSFWFLVLDYNVITEIIPLLLAACMSLLYSVKLLRAKEKASFHVGTLATAILFIVLFVTKPDNLYLIFSIVFGVIVVLMVCANIDTLFVAPPTWLAGANALSLVLTVIIYIVFYAAIQHHIDTFYVLIPLALLIIIELYIILNIKNMPSLCESKKSKLRIERITYFIAILIVAVTTIMYATEVISAEVNLFLCVVLYTVGLVYSTLQTVVNICRNNNTRSMNAGWKIIVNEV